MPQRFDERGAEHPPNDPSDPHLYFGYTPELLDAIHNAGTDYVCVKDREGRFVYINALDASLYSATPQEMLGKTTEPWVGREQFLRWYADDVAVMDAGRPRHYPVYSRTGANGVTHWFDTVKIPFRESPQGRDLLLIIHRDVTAIKKAEEERNALIRQVAASQKMESVGLLAASVAHDFNNILTIILASSRMLEQEKGLSPEASFLGQNITKSAERAAGIVERLLVLGRKEAVVHELFDLNRRLLDAGRLLASAVGERIEVLYQLASGELPIRGNAALIEQALINLVLNARDAMPRGGRIIVGTARAGQGGEVVLTVADNGDGMGPETRARVFEPFFTTKPAGQGTGLGLVVVKNVVEQHGGGVSFESEPGRGTVFRLSLPCAVASATSAPAPEGAGASSSSAPVPTRLDGKLVLLAEDEVLLQALLVKNLVMLGARVLKADTASAAWDLFLLGKEKIDLLVTDIVMPGEMDGVTLRARVFEARPEIPAIVMSGHSFNYLDDPSALPGRTVFLPKPFSIGALNKRIFELLAAGAAVA